ncbi:9136_t:CDS:2, partial [Dentiscutata heterogama]
MASITPITRDQYDFIAQLCIPLNIISLTSTVVSCVTFGFIRMYYPKLADRVSFRLSFAALFFDIGYSVHILFAIFLDDNPNLCAYSSWGIVFFGLTSLFFIVCIALNLHIVFLCEFRSRYNLENYYFIIAPFFALLLSLLPLASNISCWYRDSGREESIIWQWFTLFGWIDASILYCAIVVILVIRKLRSVKKEIDDVFDSATSQLSDYPTLINKKLISSVVKRVLWYPVVPLVAQFFNSFVETYAYVYRSISYPLFLLCYIGMSLQGLLNALVFSQDIAVTHTFHAIKLQLWISNVNSFEYLYPHHSHNKGITDEFKWLRYMLLIKLFSAPKNSSSQSIPPEFSSPNNTFARNKPNIFSVLLEKDDLKKDISLDNQNDNQDIHLAFPEP